MARTEYCADSRMDGKERDAADLSPDESCMAP